eukprot:scaffold4011_cov197-Ochromonas_danica.AAC.30
MSSNDKLVSIDMSHNRLSGSLPEYWLPGKELKEIDLSNNLLQGEVPAQLFNLPFLTILSLRQNAISGGFPVLLSDLSAIETVDMSINCLTGTLPSSLGEVPTLVGLSIESNYWTGSIPQALTNLSALLALRMSNCLLTGTIPVGFGGQNNTMSYLDVNYNFISGNIPEDVFLSTELNGVVLNDNLLLGSLSEGLAQISALSFLLLDHNHFHGSVPSQQDQREALWHLSLGNNLLSGELTASLTNLPNLNLLRLDCNLLTGPLYFLSENQSRIDHFNISSNYFSGSCLKLSFMKRAEIIDISHNMLSGSLPVTSLLTRLYYFFAQSNHLEGSMNSFFGSYTNHELSAVDVSGNQLTGSLLDHLRDKSFRSLRLELIQNCLTGTIPQALCDLTSLQVLALDGLSTAEACRNPILSSVFPQIHSYTLSKNTIHGSIPKCLFSMPQLKTLHLSGNGLIGSIAIEEEAYLGVFMSDLSLSHNELTGSLPSPLQGGNRWTNMDVSYNKLKDELQSDGDGSESNDSLETSTAGFSATSSVSLNINRLSGRILGFYYDIGEGEAGAGGQLNMLRGNLFACSEKATKSNVPQADSYHMQYDCGSDSLNSALLVWTGLLSVVGALIVLFVYIGRKSQLPKTINSTISPMAGSSSISDVEGNDQERKVGSQDEEVRVSQPSRQSLGCADSLSPADPSPHRFGCSWNTFLNSWVVTQLMNWRESLLWWPQPHKLEGNATFQVDERCESNHLWPRLHQRFVDGLISDNEKNALISILSAGKLLHHIRIVVLWLVVCMVCAGGSIYGALTVYYGSYNYEYAWTLSAAYLSGLGAACVLCVYFLVLLLPLFWSGWRAWMIERRMSQGVDDSEEKRGEDEESKTEDIHDDSGNGGGDGHQELCQENSLSRTLSDANDEEKKEELKESEKDEDIQRQKRLDGRAILAVKASIALVNVSIVLLVNGFYVYLSLQIQRWSAIMLPVALSLFKVSWGIAVQAGIVHFL